MPSSCRQPGHPAYLDQAAALARELDCTLLTLHSKRTSAAGAAHRLAHSDLIAVDVPDPLRLRLPDWETSRLLAGTVFARRTDERQAQPGPPAQPPARLVACPLSR